MQMETACSSSALGFTEWKKILELNATGQIAEPWELVAAKSVQLQFTSVEVCDFVPAEDPALSLNIDSVFGLVN